MIKIEVDDLRGPEIKSLLMAHLAHMQSVTPAESVHALDLEALRRPEITFWTAWRQDQLLGCGALKALNARHGELKSMRTAQGYLRQGVASAILQTVLEEASRRGYSRLSLETGAMSAFEPARALYARFGFEQCGPFEGYLHDPNSFFMTKTLQLP
jgi:putative acetyltransferase